MHAVTLEQLLNELVARRGWAEMGRRAAIWCFLSNPSVNSGLASLRKNPWAMAKVEERRACWNSGS